MVVIKTKQPLFPKYILNRIKRNKNFICCISGSTGSGKSWSALRLAEILDPNFDERNICFNPRQFMDLVNGKTKVLSKGSVIIFDELQVSLSHLESLSVQVRMLNFVLQTFRHKNFILIVTTPSFSFISKSARKLFHSHIETITIEFATQTNLLKPFMLQHSQRNDKTYSKYLRAYVNGMLLPVKVMRLRKPSDKLLEKYEEKKNEFTKELNESISADLRKLENKLKSKTELTDRQAEVIKLLKEGKTIPQASKIMGYTDVTNIYQHIKRIEKKGITITPVLDPEDKLRRKVVRYDVEGI